MRNPTRLLTAVNSALRPQNERVVETPYYDLEGFGRYRITSYHRINFYGGIISVVNPDVDLERLAADLGVLGKENGNG
jgi:hypothetical protein